MSKETNGIATRDDCNSIVSDAFIGLGEDTTQCPTKSEILATGKLNVLGSYADNQLVKYDDIYLKPNYVTCLYSPGVYMRYRIACGGDFVDERIGGGQFTYSPNFRIEWNGDYFNTYFDFNIQFYEIWVVTYDLATNSMVEKIKNVTDNIELTQNLDGLNTNPCDYTVETGHAVPHGTVWFDSIYGAIGHSRGTITLTEKGTNISGTINVDCRFSCVCE